MANEVILEQDQEEVIWDAMSENTDLLMRMKAKMESLDPTTKEYEAVFNNYLRLTESMNRRENDYAKNCVEVANLQLAQSKAEKDEKAAKNEKIFRWLEFGTETALTLTVLGCNLKLGGLGLKDAWSRVTKGLRRRR